MYELCTYLGPYPCHPHQLLLHLGSSGLEELWLPPRLPPPKIGKIFHSRFSILLPGVITRALALAPPHSNDECKWAP